MRICDRCHEHEDVCSVRLEHTGMGQTFHWDVELCAGCRAALANLFTDLRNRFLTHQLVAPFAGEISKKIQLPKKTPTKAPEITWA